MKDVKLSGVRGRSPAVEGGDVIVGVRGTEDREHLRLHLCDGRGKILPAGEVIVEHDGKRVTLSVTAKARK